MSADSTGVAKVVDLADRSRAHSIAAVYLQEMVWVHDPTTAGSFVLLQVDQLSGLWVVRSRFPPGTVVGTHLHSGSVSALTLSGHWSYPELQTSCGPGDYLVEQAGTVHSLVVTGHEEVDILFSINGSITYFQENGLVHRIEDWRTVLDEYTTGCEVLSRSPVVIGESRNPGP